MNIRVASFNASLNRSAEGQLITDLSTGADSQAQSVAEIIQRTDADVILINEFDYDAAGEAADLFQANYLGESQNGQGPIEYPYVYVAPSNTGVPTGLDLDNDGATDGPGDAQGFGFFEGQFGFVIYSKYPIDEANIRTFQEFLWKDMPGNLLTEDLTENPLTDFYSAEEIEILRLSSKNHVDLPVIVDGETVHILAAHPTPPVFDGEEDRNGKRNHDEIRFWSDYVEGADYIYDDAGVAGGLEADARFVIVGDYNADPFDGDSFDGAINQLLDNPLINGSDSDPLVTPSSEGGPDAAVRQTGFNETHLGDPAFDTADFGFAGFTDGVQNPDNAPGNLRVDYVLPSEAGLAYLDGAVFWQASDDPLFPLAEFPTSDHRLVYTDLRITGEDRMTVAPLEPVAATEVTPLNILLTNDDGFDAEGLERMRDALLADGHTVTVIAPLEQQSGRGTSIDTDKIFEEVLIQEFHPGDFNVDGRVVTTTIAALDFILADATPDLVVSGINEGQNVGEIAISSGTVSAAVTAILRDIPAIAVSAGIDFFNDNEAALLETYDQSAELVAAIVADLSGRAGEGLPLLPENAGLNINVPTGWDGESVAYTTVEGREGLIFDFARVSETEDDVLYGIGFDEPSGSAESEGINFAAGFATISAMDGDWSASEAVRAALETRLNDLSFEKASEASQALDIMLVNDDGFDAPGLEAMALALREAGHTVRIVAPRDPQSGRGTDIDASAIFTELEVTEFAPGDFSVASTPVNVTNAGLQALLGDAPDLVISGINEGQNIGQTAISSGTVSAAVAALLNGVPSIAVSAGIDFAEAADGFPSTDLAYEIGATFVTDLVADLIATAEGELLPEGTALSVNIPTGEIEGISFTRLDEVSPIGISFGPVSETENGLTVTFDEPNGDPLSEGSEFLGGNITVTPLDGNYTAPEPLRSEVEGIVSGGTALEGLLDGAEDPFLGSVELPSFTEFEGTTLGGLSGIIYDPVAGTYLAISDDFDTDDSDGITANRFYEIDIDLSDGSLDEGDVTLLDVIEMDPNGILPGVGTGDTEGIAIGKGGQLYISTERNADGRFPQILEVDRDGLVTGELDVDAKFEGSTDFVGVRNNLGFESLTITPDQETLYTATEGALTQDGPRAGLDNISAARIVEYDTATGEAVAEYIYEVDPIAVEPDPIDAFADSGLVELLALDNQGTLLALERSFSIGAEDRGYTGKVYLVSTRGATNVIGEDAIPVIEEDGELSIEVDETVTKTLLADLSDFGIVVDNIEGMTFGPVLEDGRQSLIIASDDNFSAFGPQANQFIALALDLETIPTLTPVLETPDELRYQEPDPIIIAHRGASGELPEHTLGAYAQAIADGADFIEPDLVSTSDGVLIARHEPWLATVETDETGTVVLDENGDPVITFASTDIAEVAKTNPDFMARLTTKDIGFSSEGLFGAVTGWFAEDFTLEEIKTLRAVEDQPDLRPQSALFDGLFEIPTFEEIIELVQQWEADTGNQVGLYPETKEPSYFDAIGLSLEENLIDTLVATGFTDPARVFIQSFEVANLLDLQQNIMPAAGLDLPLVQLLFNAPSFATYDLVEEALTGGDFSDYASLGFDASTVSGDLFTPEGLELLADVYAEGIGPSLSLVFEGEFEETDLVENAHEAGLLVHAYTHRIESEFGGLEGEAAIAALLGTGIDGIFTDNPADVVPVADAIFLDEGSDPDDPAIWLNPTDPADSSVFTAMKNGGLRVYDLDGQELQRIEPDDIRYNNIDVLYDVAGHDIAVTSDRANDTLAIFKILADGTLEDVTGDVPETIFGVDDGEATAYGLTAYTAPDGTSYAFVTQADGSQIAQLELTEDGGLYSFDITRILQLPIGDGDPADFQSEGIAVDRETGIGYVGVEEELGLLGFEADPGSSGDFTIIAPIEDFRPDIEGVSIYYGENGSGFILVSSQGDATFRIYDRESHDFLATFAIRGTDAVDGVEESDGAEIFSGALPGFDNGLLVTQDGSNETQVVFTEPGGIEVQNWNANFKYTDLGDVLDLLGFEPNPDFDPRTLGQTTLDTMPQGVASGDVTTDSVVLWTRSTELGQVTFSIYDESGVVATETADVTNTDVPVKVAIDGLTPSTSYRYDVTDAAGTTETGVFGTAAESGYNGLTFGITGDWRGDLAPYPAVSIVADAELDFMVLGGDTIYADFDSPALEATLELDGFRTKYQEVYGERAGENYWADAKASTPVYATIDDHEVVNDFAGGGLAADDARLAATEGLVNDTAEFEEGLQAFQEYHPIVEKTYGETGDDRTENEIKLYRSQTFGQDAAVMLLDQRSFRDQQIDGVLDPTDAADVVRFQTESFDPTRTLLGDVQMEELKADLLAAEAGGVTWKFVYAPEPIQDLGLNNSDSWEGYKAERTELLQFIDQNEIDNVVFVAADIHATFVNNLTYSETPLGLQIGTSAFEITTGSVAFDPAFGPAVIGAISGTDLLPPDQEAFYNTLPIAPDGDGLLNDKDDFIREAFNGLAIDPLGLDRLGLDDNLPQADGLIDATLLQGGWVSAHTYGWTEFDIDAETQALTVTTYGIPGYGPEEAGNVTDEPMIVSQFVVDAAGASSNAAFTFALVDTATDSALAELEDGAEVAAGAPSQRSILVDYVGDGEAGDDDGSILLELFDEDGELVAERVENMPESLLFGNAGADFFDPKTTLADGSYELTATAYGGNNLGGSELGSETIGFTLGSSLADEFQLDLIDAVSDEVVLTDIGDGDTLSFSALGLVAEDATLALSTDETIGSAQLTLTDDTSGEILATRLENVEPFALFGDKSGDFFKGEGLPTEDATLLVELFDDAGGLGFLGSFSLGLDFDL